MKNVEILAPVGSMEALYGAVQNGANAVYLGGKLFNARHYASNFDYEELEEIVEYCHLRYVKVYVTTNILIDDSEMEAAIDYVKYLYDIGVDGIIAQDIGLGTLVRKMMPDLEVHGSTQMTVNNLEGAKYLQDLGYTRVVLAREVPIEEIRRIHENLSIELEVFIHGALCVSYSGQCLMSSMIGGRSGNRGTCAQPCRMPSSIIDEEGFEIEAYKNKHLLSPRDLNTLEEIKELVDGGVISLKIEGRMKRPEYVATVVKNYRKALDFGYGSLTSEDKEDVEQIFSRGFTKGISFGQFGRDFITIDRPNNRGAILGKVERVDRYKVYIRLDKDLNIGDTIELRTEKGDYKSINVKTNNPAGSLLTLDKPGYILNDSVVYRTNSEELLERAKNSYQVENIKRPIDFFIEIKQGQTPKLSVAYGDISFTVEEDKQVELSQKIGLSRDKVLGQLDKLGDTNYYIENFKSDIDENSFLPLSVLNSLRRKGTDRLTELIVGVDKRKTISRDEFTSLKDQYLKLERTNRESKKMVSVRVSDYKQLRALNLDQVDRIYLNYYKDLDQTMEILDGYNLEVYLGTEKILYSEDLEVLKKMLSKYEDRLDGVLANNLGSLQVVKENFNLKIAGDTGLNVFNSYSLRHFEEAGLVSVCLSPELNINQIRTMGRYRTIDIETFTYGFLELMTMHHCPMALVKGCLDNKDCSSCEYRKGYALKDRIGAEFSMERKSGVTKLYNSAKLFILDNMDRLIEAGLDIARLDASIEEDISKELDIYYRCVKGTCDEDEILDFIDSYKVENQLTNGHYFRGVI